MNSGNAPREAGLLHRRLHQRPDARDLAQTDLVNLLRGELERGELLDHRLVVDVAFRKLRGRERGARLDQILLADEVQQLGVCRRGALGDDAARFGAQLRLFLGRDRTRHRHERHVQRVGLVRLQIGLDRPIPSRHRDFRHRVAAGQTGAHVDDLLVEVSRNVAQAAEVAAILVRGDEPFARAEAGPEERIGVERRFVGLEPHFDDLLVEHGAEHLRVDASPRATAAPAESCPGRRASSSSTSIAPAGWLRRRAADDRPWRLDSDRRARAPSPAVANPIPPCTAP